jgi:ribosome biogenesis GTPase / thiamine phosphate phosphatase
MRGRVARSTGNYYSVFSEAGEYVMARLSGKMRLAALKHTNPVAVGDYVVMVTDENQPDYLIESVEDRSNFLIRRATNLSRQTHILAANLDQIVLIASLVQPRTSTGFLDRILVTAEAYSIPASIVFNKRDLWNEKENELAEYYMAAYRRIGYEAYAVSALEATDILEWKSCLAGKTSLLIGHSGAGKSTLLNAVQPGLGLRVGEISRKHKKGTHTTTFAQMFQMENGGWVIDSPGIKEFGLFEIPDRDLADYFPEFFSLRSKCRFPDCSHTNEPSCGVLEALELGEIMPERYQNYLQMLASNRDDYKR